MEFLDIDWQKLLIHLVKITGTFILALPIALEREKSTRVMGLRTFPLVAIASCGYILVAEEIVGDSPEGHARVIEGLMAGIGFIGGGAILKRGAGVRGTATAASIWTIGIVGAAMGYGEVEIAILISVINFIVLWLMTPLSKRLDMGEQKGELEPEE